ncbi:MAG: GAF domain-containing protein [Acidobacteriota bacterium]
MEPGRDELAAQLDQKTAQLRAVGQIGAALAAAWELDATLEAITRITSEVMRVDSCSIYLQDRSAGRLVLKATTGLAREAIGHASLRAGEGLTGWAVTHGEPVSAPLASGDPRFKLLPETHEEGLKSLLAVPLVVQGRTIGAINVQTAEAHWYTADEVDLLTLIANLAAGALEKASLYEKMRKRIEELSTLAEVSRTVTSPLYLDEMLGVVTEMAARVTGAKATSLHLLDESSGQLVLHATHNTDPGAREYTSMAVGQGVVGQVAAGGVPVAILDARTDERFMNRAWAEREGLVSVMSVPLVVRDRTVGVFTCYTDVAHEFTAKETELFQTLANQTALAIENARLVINAAVVREMHHRIKNNLQTVAMLLRLQKSAARNLTAEDVLAETINRILSIAAVHETLSEKGLRVVDVREVLERVARSVGDTMLVPGQSIEVTVSGDTLVLPSREATSLALAASELLQNAVKHAFVGRSSGRIELRIENSPDENRVVVEDNGVGTARRSTTGGGIGHQIVDALVKDDLKGSFDLSSGPAGTRATIRFAPALSGPVDRN